MSEEVTYLKHDTGVYDVFAKDGGHMLGLVEGDGVEWWAGPHRYPTRRAAAEMLLDRFLAQASETSASTSKRARVDAD